MSDPSFKRGDIVRWKAFFSNVEYCYGLVLESESVSQYGYMEYPFFSHDDMFDLSYATFCTRRIVVFSFHEQKVTTVYQSAYDVPSFPEMVHVYKASEESEDL